MSFDEKINKEAKTRFELEKELDKWKIIFIKGTCGDQDAYNEARDLRPKMEKEKFVSVNVGLKAHRESIRPYLDRLADLEAENDVRKQKLQELLKQLLEPLAEFEHQQWASWITYLQSLKLEDLVLNLQRGDFKGKWEIEANTPYSELTDKQKESDRKFARKVLALLEEVLK